MYPVRLGYNTIIGQSGKFMNNIARARNGPWIRRRTQWDASGTGHWTRKQETQVIDTCKGEAVRSSKRAEAQRPVHSRVSTHLVIEFVQIAHSQGYFRSACERTPRWPSTGAIITQGREASTSAAPEPLSRRRVGCCRHAGGNQRFFDRLPPAPPWQGPPLPSRPLLPAPAHGCRPDRRDVGPEIGPGAGGGAARKPGREAPGHRPRSADSATVVSARPRNPPPGPAAGPHEGWGCHCQGRPAASPGPRRRRRCEQRIVHGNLRCCKRQSCEIECEWPQPRSPAMLRCHRRR